MPYYHPSYGRPRTGCFGMFAVPLTLAGIVFCILVTVRPDGVDLITPLMNKVWPLPTARVATSPHETLSITTLHGHPPTDSHVLHTPPSLSASFLDQVLRLAHSPAQGTGAALYALSEAYGVDDVFALAFFEHESRFGTTGVAVSTHSLGNIRCAGSPSCLDGYRAYPDWATGYDDWYRLIRDQYVTAWHLDTVETIVPTYAPTSDHNDVGAYITAVLTSVATWRGGRVQL